MNFPVPAYFGVLLLSLAGTLLCLPAWRRWCVRIGHTDNPQGRKDHQRPIALAGGPAVLCGFLLPVAAGWIALTTGLFSEEDRAALQYGFEQRYLQLAAIFIGALAMVWLGWIDDRHALKPSVKFGGQLAIALLVAASGIRITLFIPNVAFSYFITVFWMLTLINAMNFMDNMNGLCAGIGAIAALFFALIAGLHGQYLVAMMACAIAGALLGFLPYNYPGASSFLGDAGSHLTGYLMAVLAILPHFYSEENPNPLAVISPLLILGVPLIDLVWVVIIRWRLGKPFYIGDHNHLSHRLVRRGYSRPKAVLFIWILGLILGLLALGLNVV